MKSFLDLADLGREEVADLIALARRLQEHPEPRALAGRAGVGDQVEGIGGYG